jgi:hypothetical protein
VTVFVEFLAAAMVKLDVGSSIVYVVEEQLVVVNGRTEY